MDMGKLEARFKVWDAKIEVLSAKAEKARGPAKSDLHYQVDDLKAKRAMALARLVAFRAARGENRRALAAEFENAWDDLEAALKRFGW